MKNYTPAFLAASLAIATATTPAFAQTVSLQDSVRMCSLSTIKTAFCSAVDDIMDQLAQDRFICDNRYLSINKDNPEGGSNQQYRGCIQNAKQKANNSFSQLRR